MKLNITARNFAITPAISNHVEEKFKKLERFKLNNEKVEVKLYIEKNNHIVHVTFHMNNMHFDISVSSGDMYSAINKMAKILDQRVKKAIGKEKDSKRRIFEKKGESL